MTVLTNLLTRRKTYSHLTVADQLGPEELAAVGLRAEDVIHLDASTVELRDVVLNRARKTVATLLIADRGDGRYDMTTTADDGESGTLTGLTGVELRQEFFKLARR